MEPAINPGGPPPFNRPFTRQEFTDAGYDPRLLRRTCFEAVFKGVWVHVDCIDDMTRIRAALVAHPAGAIASHFSAARVYRLPVPDHPFEHVTVFRPRDRRRRDGVKSHVTTRLRRARHVRDIPVLDPVSTFIQLAGHLSLVDLVVVGDALVREFSIAPARLVRLCARSGDYYARRAAEAAGYVRVGVDSPMESILRMLIVLAGLPEPQTNVQLFDESGALRRRFDLYYAGVRVIVEYDGRQHARDTAQWKRDLHRREEFDDDGYRILVVTAEGIYRDPERTLERVRRLLVARGMTDVPPVGDAWRHHFAAWSRARG
ncbi:MULTISPECIES: endonuclease domain-containing protein [unclassified Nocardioides]|uniref:endonuclease domain-containing protein n=1 Tax=unclassified Nocardioides TaxID=2615069 RepID=UPI003607DC3B